MKVVFHEFFREYWTEKELVHWKQAQFLQNLRPIEHYLRYGLRIFSTDRCPFKVWVPLIGALQAFVVRKTSGNLRLSQKFLFLRIDVTTDWQNTFHTSILLFLITELIFLSKCPSHTKNIHIQHQKGWYFVC